MPRGSRNRCGRDGGDGAQPADREGRQVLLRVDPAAHDALIRSADDEFRSVNGHAEMLLRRAINVFVFSQAAIGLGNNDGICDPRVDTPVKKAEAETGSQAITDYHTAGHSRLRSTATLTSHPRRCTKVGQPGPHTLVIK
jgi:hypothetical protein